MRASICVHWDSFLITAPLIGLMRFCLTFSVFSLTFRMIQSEGVVESDLIVFSIYYRTEIPNSFIQLAKAYLMKFWMQLAQYTAS